jgi:hypothetical protein
MALLLNIKGALVVDVRSFSKLYPLNPKRLKNLPDTPPLRHLQLIDPIILLCRVT